MASSGNVYSSVVGGLGSSPDHMRLDWSIANQSIAGNYTDINWNIRGWGGASSGYWVTNFNAITKINGSTVQNKGQFSMYHNGVFGSGTKRIYHNNDGTKTFNINLSGRIYYNQVNSTASQNFTLPTIPRNAVITSNETQISDSDPLDVTISNPGNQYVKLYQRWTHVVDDTKIWISRNLGRFSGTYTMNPTQGEFDTLYSNNPNKYPFDVKVIARTYTDSGYNNEIGSAVGYELTFTPENAQPVFSDFTYRDKNATTSAITGNDQVMIANHSEMEVTIPVANKAVAQKFATMDKYESSLIGTTLNQSWQDALDVVFDHGVVASQVNTNQSVKAIDSRGLNTTINKTITVVPYEAPVVNASASRLNNFESDTTLEVSGSFSKIMVGGVAKNTIGASAVEYRYKLQDGSWTSWASLSRTLGDGTFTCSDVPLSLDNSKYVDFEVRATDELNTTTTAFRMSSGKPIFYVDAKRNAVGIGQIPPTDEQGIHLLQADRLYRHIYPVGSIYETSDLTFDPAVEFGGTWEDVTFTHVSKVLKTDFAVNSTSNIVIPTGFFATFAEFTWRMASSSGVSAYFRGYWVKSSGHFIAGNYQGTRFTSTSQSGGLSTDGSTFHTAFRPDFVDETTLTLGVYAFSSSQHFEALIMGNAGKAWKRTA